MNWLVHHVRPGFALALFVIALVGCATDTSQSIDPEDDLYHPSPGRRLAAVQSVADTGDRVWMPVLVDLLEDPDPSVRMAANQTLESMDGFQTDYRAYASAAERRPHVETWRIRIAGADGRDTVPGLTPDDSATTFPPSTIPPLAGMGTEPALPPAEASVPPAGPLPPLRIEEGSR